MVAIFLVRLTPATVQQQRGGDAVNLARGCIAAALPLVFVDLSPPVQATYMRALEVSTSTDSAGCCSLRLPVAVAWSTYPGTAPPPQAM